MTPDEKTKAEFQRVTDLMERFSAVRITVGQFLTEFALLESALTAALRSVSTDPELIEHLPGVGLGFAGRKNLLVNLAGERDLPKPLVARITGAAKRMHVLLEKRNEIAHEAVVLLRTGDGALDGGVPRPRRKQKLGQSPALHTAAEILELQKEALLLTLLLESVTDELEAAKAVKAEAG